ncbi:branched-chain amino acid ABC transporter permease [Shinella sp.]|uniref:branched-chain amino acid ABC transporter permease n=1 Tax=Shinella sp. TaxID=1870904 RepID=UPI0029B4D065|nr:branched-chain amino acid ABC transporter permease [Shinella sp.]MDX3978601.1 branched-chain amino acid ABC transporter permease [Shinella sp.]
MMQFAQLIVFGVVQGLTYALLAASFWIIYSTTRTFHLAHSLTYAIAGYAAYLTSAQLGLSLWLGLVASLVCAALFGCAIEALLYRQLRRRASTVLGIFLSSLGVAAAGTALLQIVFGPMVKQVPGFPNATLASGEISVTTLQLTGAFAALAAISAVTVLLTRTSVGNAVTAVRTNPRLAMAVGIRVERISLLVFALGSAMAGLAAYFETIAFVAYPTMGLQPVMFGVIGVFLGGTGSIKGAALGGFVLGFLLVFSGLFLSQNLGVILVFAMLLVIIVFRPEGLIRSPMGG